mmetsp:Transcript_25115/g.52139  ORF Transcript_25115/g.52139 Transcript_25115/m.52139 type:complete len:294 (+) Transcript_25115:417-1298(+)
MAAAEARVAAGAAELRRTSHGDHVAQKARGQRQLSHFPQKDVRQGIHHANHLGGAAAVVRFREVVARPGRAIGGNRFASEPIRRCDARRIGRICHGAPAVHRTSPEGMASGRLKSTTTGEAHLRVHGPVQRHHRHHRGVVYQARKLRTPGTVQGTTNLRPRLTAVRREPLGASVDGVSTHQCLKTQVIDVVRMTLHGDFLSKRHGRRTGRGELAVGRQLRQWTPAGRSIAVQERQWTLLSLLLHEIEHLQLLLFQHPLEVSHILHGKDRQPLVCDAIVVGNLKQDLLHSTAVR